MLWKGWKNQKIFPPLPQQTTTAATRRDGSNHHHIDLEDQSLQQKTVAVEKGGEIVYNRVAAGKE